MKLRFSVRSLLQLFIVCALTLAILVTPRLTRQRVLGQLEEEPIVWNVYSSDAGALDRLLGVNGPLESIWFDKSDENDTLTKKLFEITARLSPFPDLVVSDLKVEPCDQYPRVEKITILNLTGPRAAEWMRGLLAAQTHTKKVEIEGAPSFTDEHLAILGHIDAIESITVVRASVSGTGIREFSRLDHQIELLIENCPISDDGLKAIAECRNLKSLGIGFTWGLDPLPDMKLLLRAPRSLDIEVVLGPRCAEDAKFARIKTELDHHFGYPVVFR